MNKTNEKWLPVPGFASYEVSSLGKVRKINGGLLKYDKRRGYGLTRDGKQYSLRPQRLLYAALHDVDPTDMKEIIILEVKGNLIPMTRSEYMEYVNARRKKPVLDEIEVKEYYEYAIRFAQMMLSYYETRDITEVAEELSKYEGRIRAYIYKAGFHTSDRVADEAWNTIYADILSRIVNGEISIINPYNYMRKCVRSYFSEFRKNKSKMVQFDERKGMFLNSQEWK